MKRFDVTARFYQIMMGSIPVYAETNEEARAKAMKFMEHHDRAEVLDVSLSTNQYDIPEAQPEVVNKDNVVTLTPKKKDVTE